MAAGAKRPGAKAAAVAPAAAPTTETAPATPAAPAVGLGMAAGARRPGAKKAASAPAASAPAEDGATPTVAEPTAAEPAATEPAKSEPPVVGLGMAAGARRPGAKKKAPASTLRGAGGPGSRISPRTGTRVGARTRRSSAHRT